MPRFDTVVSFVLYRTAETEVAAAVEQVLASPGAHHVVLVDNSEQPLGLNAFVRPEVTVIRPGRNLGYGSGHNLALRQFADQARYHLVLNTDLIFDADVIPTVIRFMDANPKVGLAMPAVRYPSGEIQRLCRLLPRPTDMFARAFLPNSAWTRALNRRYESQDWGYDQPISFPFLSGCFMVLRPAALNKAGLFDERFFLFAEDLDLSRRIHRNFDTVMCPAATVIHEYRTQSVWSLRRKFLQVQNLVRYFNKFGWIFDHERRVMNRRALARVRAALGQEG